MASLAYKTEIYTYEDYLNLPDDKRYELIEGVFYDMASPSRIHQRISMELSKQIAVFLTDKPCEIYAAPFDVRLPEKNEKDEEIITVVQPDISVICDLKKLDNKGCKGSPDFIAEIISPGTAAKDNIQKVYLYEKHKVREYWIIHPTDKLITIRLLGRHGKYEISHVYQGKGKLPVSVLNGLNIDLDAIFKE